MSIEFARVCKSWVAAALLLGCVGVSAAETTAGGKELVRTYCSGCHQERAGGFNRISDIRKSPEGWVMTLFRMRQVHGLALEPGVHDELVRYLSDTQGLAPAESHPGRFALERRPNAQDLDLGPDINVMCGRCHSLARVELQRRDEEEWRKLANMHVGQWPSLEYQASGRDRPWYQIATTQLPAKLAAMYPYTSDAWTAWQGHKPSDLSGDWIVVGRATGGQDFYGTAHIERDAGVSTGGWHATYAVRDTAGVDSSGGSKAIVYTGYEWRGSAELGGRDVREVFAVSEDGTRIEGRWFDPDHAEVGGEWLAVRDTGPAAVIAVLPRKLQAGHSAEIVVVGTGFGSGKQRAAPALSLGDGITLADARYDAHVIRAQAKAAPDAAPGLRTVSIGKGAAGGATLAVFRQIDQINIIPAYGIARVGGGRIAPVAAQFEALASTRLANGELLPLGPVTAEWSSAPYDAEAKRTEDEKFAGHFDRRGYFLPAGAGPNPGREFSGDNVGNLSVIARVQDGTRQLDAKAHLIVTVQRWNTPPIY